MRLLLWGRCNFVKASPTTTTAAAATTTTTSAMTTTTTVFSRSNAAVRLLVSGCWSNVVKRGAFAKLLSTLWMVLLQE